MIKANKHHLPEILAPAGNPEALRAAINGGADAVYLGMKTFSARRRAGNFSFEDLEEGLALAHTCGVKVYVVVNTLIKDSELEAVNNLLARLSETDVDGLILQDIGLIWLVRRFYPEFSLQLSTQASVYGLEGARFFDALGFDRVVLARETGIEEAAAMKDQLATEIKIFNHGALCYAYSGQCHLSSAIGARSGNRGGCAQPCRRRYRLAKNGKTLKDGFLLSTKDLSTLSRTDELLAAGVDALKIEGRMKTPEYVYAVSKAYRDALDGKPVDMNAVEAVFNRDFTEGRLFKNTHNLSQGIAKKRGVFIGTTGKLKNGRACIRLSPGVVLRNGDGISFGEDENTGGYVSGIYSADGEKLAQGQGDVYLALRPAPQAGLGVYRSYDKSVMDALRRAALAEPKPVRRPVDFHVLIQENAPVQVDVTSGAAHAHYVSDVTAQPAKTKALDAQTVAAQFSRLGTSAYSAGSVSADVAPGLFLPKSALNQLRTGALEVLEQSVEKPEKHSVKKAELPPPAARPPVKKELSVRFEDLPDAALAAALPADEIVLTVKDFNNLEPVRALIREIKQTGKRVLLTTPVVLHSDVCDVIKHSGFLELAGDGYIVPNYELLELLKDKDVYKEADESLNVFNRLAGKALKNWGVQAAVLSDELSGAEIKELSGALDMPSVLTVAGRRRLMISANCVFDCPTCKNCKNQGWYDLSNDRGDRFVLRVEDGNNIIYNAEETWLADVPSEQPYLSKLRINITNEDAQDVKKMAEEYRALIDGAPGRTRNPGNYTNGVE